MSIRAFSSLSLYNDEDHSYFSSIDRFSDKDVFVCFKAVSLFPNVLS